MALIRCSECGREISDKAAACIHCGCPITASTTVNTTVNTAANNAPRSLSVNFNAVLSGAETEKTMQTVYVAQLGRNVEFAIDNNTQVGETIKITLREGSPVDYIMFTATTVSRTQQTASAGNAVNAQTSAGNVVNAQTAADAIATIKRYKPNFLVKFFKSGFIKKVVGMTITFVVAGRFGDVDKETIALLVGAGILLMWLGSLYPMANVKRYYRKHNIEDAIRRDAGNMNVAICAYNVLPTYKMLKYIRGLNPAAVQEIERQLEERKKK